MVSLRDQTIKQLRDEIAALKVERDRIASERDYWKEAASDALIERDTMRALLREVEWLGGYGGRMATCPMCRADKAGPFKGHSPDCRLKAALETD